MVNIREKMPVLARHEGDWIGEYLQVDPTGNILDRHESRLTCQFPETGEYDYYQINRYTWVDGRREEHVFPGIYRDNALWFDTERITGKAWEADNATIILHFSYKGSPGSYLYEMIQISPCNNYRARTWQWFKDNRIDRRTLIQEERVR